MSEKELPRGVPSLTYVRVLDQSNIATVDVTTDGGYVTIMEPGMPSTKYEVACAFDKSINDQQFCESTIGPSAGANMGASLNPIAAFVEDSATSAILLIGSSSTKKWQFLKRVFLPFVANELFACLNDKLSSGSFYQFSLSLSSFEILDEVISDLLKPSSRGLTIVVSPEEGVIVSGLRTEVIKSEVDLRQLLLDSCENRASHTLPPGGSIDSSSAIWEITLSQKESVGDIVLCNTSKLLVLDTPAVNPLCLSTSEIRLLEGPNLHKSLFGFADVLRKLASPALTPLAPFRCCKLTRVLSELLGGNAIVVALGLVSLNESAISKKTMQIMDHLTCARHFPISGKEMSEIVQGLLIKYRTMINNADDDRVFGDQAGGGGGGGDGFPSGGNGNGINKKNVLENENKVLAEQVKKSEELIVGLQKEVNTSKLEVLEAKEDCVKIYELLELVKSKYATLAEQKNKQTEDFVSLENEELELARALIELRLQYSELKESSEKTRFELTSEALALKNEIFQLDGQMQLLRVENMNNSRKCEELHKSYSSERDERVEAMTQLTSTKKSLEEAQENNLRLGAELITLVNNKDTLTLEINECKRKVSDLEKLLNNEGNETTALRSANESLEIQLHEMEEAVLSAKKRADDAEFESKIIAVELEKSKLDFEKSASEYLKNRDQSFKKESLSIQSELQHVIYEKDQLVIALRREERKNRDMKKDRERDLVDKEYALHSSETLKTEYEELKQKYREHLSQEMEFSSTEYTPRFDINDIMHSARIKNDNEASLQPVKPSNTQRSQSLKHMTEKIIMTSRKDKGGSAVRDDNLMTWDELLESYNSNEKRLYEKLAISDANLNSLKVTYRELFDNYSDEMMMFRIVVDALSDHAPQALPTNIIDEDHNWFHVKNVVKSSANDDQFDQFNPVELKYKINILENKSITDNENFNKQIVKLKKVIEKSDIRIQELVKENKLLGEKNVFLNDHSISLVKQNESNLKEVYSRLEEQMEEIQRTSIANKLQSQSDLQLHIKDLNKQIKILTRKNRLLVDDNSALHVTMQKSQDAYRNIAGLASVAVASTADNPSVPPHFLAMMRDMEDRNAQLTSANASLETQIMTYQQYMSTTIADYKDKINKLQTELKQLSRQSKGKLNPAGKSAKNENIKGSIDISAMTVKASQESYKGLSNGNQKQYYEEQYEDDEHLPSIV